MRILHFSLIVLLAVIYCAAATSTDTKSWSKTESKGHSKTASSWVHSGTSKAPHKDLDHHHHNSTKEHGLSKECERLKKLEETVQIFSNATKLEGFEKKHNLTSEEVAKLQDKAQNITAELEKLKSNTTLITECIKLEEHLKLLHKCDEIKKLTFIVGIASNTTEDSELEKHFRINLTSSDEAKLSKFVANATAQLAKLEANATLVAECEKLVNITIRLVEFLRLIVLPTKINRTTAPELQVAVSRSRIPA